jgi:endonuclease YncB( thermonuclease family)|tara:strand:+ start:426 stop:887 length:462 start_codon:yes stop_codon:yes gene_type:complete
MVLEHDFKNFPELSTEQMNTIYFESPHKQIFEDFKARVVKVTDGDTVRLETDFRDFKFPLRIRDIDAPELNQEMGIEAKAHLTELIEGEEVEILIDPTRRLEKWGRLLGDIVHNGIQMSEEMERQGFAIPFNRRREGQFEPVERIFNEKQWQI